MPTPLPYYEAQTLSLENSMIAQLARCTLVHGDESTQAKVALAVVSALQCLPLASLVACALLGVWVHLLKGGSASVKLGAVPVEFETIEAIDAKAAQLQEQIRHRRLESSPKVKFQLWMEFVVFLLDYLSDYNCLRTFIVEGAYGVAAVQGVIIAAPVVLDCYRGKIQLVEVFGAFIESRKRGFPTDDFILALRSEKSLEAALSKSPYAPKPRSRNPGTQTLKLYPENLCLCPKPELKQERALRPHFPCSCSSTRCCGAHGPRPSGAFASPCR